MENKLISEDYKKRIKQLAGINEVKNNCLLPEGSFADALRKDLIEQFLKNYENDNEYNLEEPDIDMLLDPYEGYEKQTYIQNNLENNEFILWEGFSDFCWDSFLNQKQYESLSKEDIIKHFIDNRAKNLGLEFGFKLINSNYFFEETNEYSDYIIKLTYKKAN